MQTTAFIFLLSAQVIVIAGLLRYLSKRRSIEADLIRSNERLRAAMESGKSVGWDWDIVSGRDFWFGDLQTFFGIPSNARTGRVEDFFRYVHPEDRQRVGEAVAEARRNRTPYSLEFRIVRQDGSTVWVASRGEFQYAADGSAERMLGLAVDVTEKKRIEEALQKSEEKYCKAFQQIPVSLVLTSFEDGRFIEVNSTHEVITGWSHEDLIGRTSLELGIWIDPDERAEFKRQLLTGKPVRNFECGLRRKNGDVRKCLMNAELIEINGDPCILAATMNITELKAAEAALRESEERFRLVASSAPVTIWMSDVNNNCIYVNERWIEFTGRPLEAQLGNGWIESIHPEDAGRCLDTFMKAVERREPLRAEYRLRRYDGEYFWMLDSGVPRFNADGSFAGYIGSAIDMTEIKLAEEVLSTVSQRLIEAHEEERAWIARELHDDIGQRLVVLRMKLERIKGKLLASPTELDQELLDASKQIEDLGVDIQTLSRDLHPSKLKFLGLAKAAAGFCAELSDRQNLEIEFHSENVPADLSEEISLCLYRTLQEALQNAIKHSGSPRVQVFLSCRSNEILLAVHDSGIGFDRVQAMKQQGLGLTSMKERLKTVNGTLLIESQLHHGTTIHARVPVNSLAKTATPAR